VLLHQSRVRLISDPDHAIPLQSLRTGQRSVAFGSGDPGLLRLPNLPVHSDLREGDVLVTSGLGDRFPPGFPVAEVTRIERDTGGAFARVEARPLAALDRGREVLLVLPGEAPQAAPGEAEAIQDGEADEALPTDAGTATQATAEPESESQSESESEPEPESESEVGP